MSISLHRMQKSPQAWTQVAMHVKVDDQFNLIQGELYFDSYSFCYMGRLSVSLYKKFILMQNELFQHSQCW